MGGLGRGGRGGMCCLIMCTRGGGMWWRGCSSMREGGGEEGGAGCRYVARYVRVGDDGIERRYWVRLVMMEGGVGWVSYPVPT